MVTSSSVVLSETEILDHIKQIIDEDRCHFLLKFAELWLSWPAIVCFPHMMAGLCVEHDEIGSMLIVGYAQMVVGH